MKIITPIILILAAVGLFFVYTDATYRQVKILLIEQSQYDRALNQSKELQSIRDKLLSRYNTFSTTDIKRLEKILPDNVDNVRLILDIDNIASKYGMSISNIAVEQIEEDKSPFLGTDNRLYSSITISFRVSSGYKNFISFLKDIERSLRLMDVVSINFNAGDDDFNTYDLSIRTYWLK